MRFFLFALQATAWFVPALARLPCGITFPMADYVQQLKRHPEKESSNFTGLPGSLSKRAATMMGPNDWTLGRYFWPRSKSTKLANIPYCYRTPEIRNLLKDRIDRGIQAWYDALGGPPSEASGHGVHFKERQDGCGNPLYCGDEAWNWNSDVPPKTVSIWSDNTWGNFANIGYIRSPRPWDMVLNLQEAASDADAIHELGHLIGLIHEHQRKDRDEHVIFRCEKLIDFQRVWEQVQQEDPSITSEQLCTDMATAQRFGFSAINFIPLTSPGNQAWYGITPYDTFSITHYASLTAVIPACWDNIGECPLVKKRDAQDQEGERLLRASFLSFGDVDFVQIWNPRTWQTQRPPMDQTEKGNLGGGNFSVPP